jgi:ligand-binding SRPBCC domain-containing protein
VPVPRFVARLALGELADELLVASARVHPAKLLETGFRFEDGDILLALCKNTGAVSTLRKTQWIARPVDEVFPFFADANNLEGITPPWLKFKLLNSRVQMGRGALIDYRLNLHGIPLRWQSEITEWEPPYRFVDVQRHGPYRLWIHDHRFEPHDGGTLIHDTVQYSAPGGTWMRALFIDRDLDSIFNYRRKRLEEHFA